MPAPRSPRRRSCVRQAPAAGGQVRGRGHLTRVVLAATLLVACQRRVEVPPQLAETTSCPPTGTAEVVGHLADPGLDEVSGLVASRRQPGILWVHNDSGAGPTVYAIDSAGASRAALTLDNASAVDWEDIALGPGPDPDVDYLYIGDIGDNRRHRSSVTVYRIAEPPLDRAEGGMVSLRAEAEVIELRYDQRPANAEALLVDPDDGGLFIITKEVGTGGLYRAEAGVLRRVAGVDVGAEALVTAADISADGRSIAVRTYNHGYLWRREPGESLDAALARPPCALKVAQEPQGEALGFDPEGGRLFSLSESRDNGGGEVPIHSIPLGGAP